MRKTTAATILCAILLVFAASMATLRAENDSTAANPPRYLRIDLPEVFKRTDMPFAMFNHELHSKKYEKQGCEICHRPVGKSGAENWFERRVVVYGEKDGSEKIKDAYHAYCNQCHAENSDNPITCKTCHDPLKEYRPAQWIARELTLSQHEKMHLFARGNCAECHHGYINAKKAKQKKFVFSCRTCHGKEQQGKARAMSEIAHERCLSCHVKAVKTAEYGGPTECVPCHVKDQGDSLDTVEDMSKVKRLDAGQKDTVYIFTEGATRPGVMFDHKGHEKNVRSCRACHHKDMQACSTCHTLANTAKNKTLGISDAFMEMNSKKSCIGCHETQKQKKPCSYCHERMAPRASEDSCDVCHTGRPVAKKAAKPKQKSIEGLPASLPEVLTIEKGLIAAEPVKFPHAKIIRILSEGASGSRLAAKFHGGKSVVCAKCHHKSVNNPTNEKCSACHPKTSDGKKETVSLGAALKTLCEECHTWKPKSR